MTEPVSEPEPSEKPIVAWMNDKGWFISARGKIDMGQFAEADGYDIPLVRLK